MKLPTDTDKVANGYWPTYLELAAEFGPGAIVLEIGVQGGGGLRLFQTLFPLGEVVGVDHDPNSTWPEGTLRIVAEQTSPSLPALLSLYTFDLIVDDASHDAMLTKTTFYLLWETLRPGGAYVIEDWGVAFPGSAPIYDPGMLEFAQSLLVLLADPHMGQVEEITYRDGLIIIRKAT